MDYNQIILFSDLDDTLLNEKKQVSVQNKEAIAHFIKQGGTFSICSGRNEINTLSILDEKHINGPSVLYNGSAIYDFQEKKFIHIECLPCLAFDSFLKQILNAFSNVDIMLYQPSEINYITPFERVHYEHYKLHAPCNFVSWEKVLEKKTFMKILFCGINEDLKKIQNEIEQSSLKRLVDCVRTNPFYLEVLPKNINKGYGLNIIKKNTPYQKKTFIAIGDYYNDLEMLEKADIAICPMNALDIVKQKSDYVVASCNHHALYDLIMNLIPKL